MKLRFYPKTYTVRELLLKRIAEAKKGLEEDVASLEKARDPKALIVGVADPQHLEHLVKAGEQLVADRMDELAMLDSHAPSEVLCEIEV